MSEGGRLKFKDRVAIVTGGCNGIGRGCVDAFLEEGGKVAVLDIDDSTGTQMFTTGPGEVFFVHCDTSVEENIEAAIEATVHKFGRIDCLVNNAGIHPRWLPIDDFNAEDFRRLLDLNLIAYFLTCKYALPHIRKVKGSVVNMSSVNAMLGRGKAAPYTATKGAVSAMTKDLAIDEAVNGVRVNAICPGPIYTPLFQKLCSPEEDRFLEDVTLLRRHGKPVEVGKACLFLATDATVTTGTCLSVTGGTEVGFGSKYSS